MQKSTKLQIVTQYGSPSTFNARKKHGFKTVLFFATAFVINDDRDDRRVLDPNHSDADCANNLHDWAA